jgi:hypothetical protein
MTKLDGQRLAQARDTAEALLDELELGSAPIMNSLLKAKRLARLMRDEDAQTWLDLEARGYPPNFSFGPLGTCVQYARAAGRITHENKYYCNSLPQFEADLEASHIALQGIQFPVNVAPSVSSSNANELTGIWVSNSIQHLTETYKETLANAKKTHSHNASMFNGLKSALHNYATDCHHALSLSDAAQNLFEKARESVDKFVRAAAPKAAGADSSSIRTFRLRRSGGTHARPYLVPPTASVCRRWCVSSAG